MAKSITIQEFNYSEKDNFERIDDAKEDNLMSLFFTKRRKVVSFGEGWHHKSIHICYKSDQKYIEIFNKWRDYDFVACVLAIFGLVV